MTGNSAAVANPLRELHAWQRFHIKLIGFYGGAVFLALAMLGGAFYKIEFEANKEGLQQRLLVLATTLANSIDVEALSAIPVEAGATTPFHQALRDRFTEVASHDPDVASIYVLRPTSEPTRLRFFVDYVKSGESGKPGEMYQASEMPILLKGFAAPAVEDKIYVDRFGATLSGYAPVVNKTGQTVALVGVDVKAERLASMQGRILRTTLLIFGGAALLIGCLSLAIARHVRKPLVRIIDATAAVERGELNIRLNLQRKDEFGLMSRHFDYMVAGLQEREFLRETFGRYVSKDVANLLLTQRGRSDLNGEERVVTILFSDLRDYSIFCEHLPPAKMVEMLNQYLTAMDALIDQHHGCVIEFMGDAILAVFGAPYYRPDHPEQAVRCAIAMQTQLERLNREWRQEGATRSWAGSGSEYVSARIGIHYGAVIAGSLGSPTRMKYTVVGDTVNVAARLEALNKELGTEILIGGEVYRHLPADLAGQLVDLGEFRVKGYEFPIHVYTYPTTDSGTKIAVPIAKPNI
ncbi:MAG: adenylate/guanylate cyclase domain-containing protein [Candidatus Competibacteraceae bacterium]